VSFPSELKRRVDSEAEIKIDLSKQINLSGLKSNESKPVFLESVSPSAQRNNKMNLKDSNDILEELSKSIGVKKKASLHAIKSLPK
jgi:hypothetical protein